MVTLTAAVSGGGAAQPLLDGEVELNGVQLKHVRVEPQVAAYRRMVRQLEFDVCELALTNARSNIQAPHDLEGKSFGVRAYTVTTGVWARGILQSEYGVDPLRAASNSPAAILATSGDAGIGRTGSPTATWKPVTVAHAPLCPNASELERSVYQRTGIFPLHGVIVISNAVLDAHPWVAAELQRAFQSSKALYLRRLAEQGARTAMDRTVLANQAMIGGGDPLPFGLEANRPTFEALVEYAAEQKIIPSRIQPESVLV